MTRTGTMTRGSIPTRRCPTQWRKQHSCSLGHSRRAAGMPPSLQPLPLRRRRVLSRPEQVASTRRSYSGRSWRPDARRCARVSRRMGLNLPSTRSAASACESLSPRSFRAAACAMDLSRRPNSRRIWPTGKASRRAACPPAPRPKIWKAHRGVPSRPRCRRNPLKANPLKTTCRPCLRRLGASQVVQTRSQQHISHPFMHSVSHHARQARGRDRSTEKSTNKVATARLVRQLTLPVP